MHHLLMTTKKRLRFRLGYDLLPVLDSSAPPNRNLNILIASTGLGEQDAITLARAQYAKWFCDDMACHIELLAPSLLIEKDRVISGCIEIPG